MTNRILGFHRCVSAFAAALSILWLAPAYSAYVQWQYWANWDPNTKFLTEKEAANHMRGAPSWKAAYLVVRGPIVQMGRDYYQREWTTEPVDPIVGEWEYEPACGGSGTYAIYAEALSACIQEIKSGAECSGFAQYVGEGEWEDESSFFLGLPRNKKKYIYVDQWVPSGEPESPECSYLITNPQTFIIFAERTATCPSGYSQDTSINKCVLNYVGYTSAKPVTTCGEEVGNPCDVANGAKLLREVDYSGPGMELTRVFNSQGENAWTHNFSGYLAVLNGTMTGAIRHGGQHHEPFRNYSGKYVSYTGSGLEARLVSGEWVLYYPSGARDYYNSSGVLLRRENASGLVTTVNRDASGNIQSITGPFGHTLTFHLNAVGGIEKITDPAGNDIAYEYSGANLSKVTYQDGSIREYHYEDLDFPNFVTGITDENEDRFATYVYDGQGRVIESEHAGGYGEVQLSYSASSTSVSDAAGTTTYDFTTDQYRMRKITSKTRDGQTRSYTYPSWSTDNQQRPSKVTYENGAVTQYTYGIHHKVTEVQAFGSPEARTLNFYYLDEPTDRLTRVTSPSVYGSQHREVETTYNTASLPETIEVSGYTPSGVAVTRSLSLEYNTSGQVIEIDGPRTDVSDITTLEYYDCTSGYECGQLESVTNALGHVTTYDAYDAHGRLLEMADPNGLVTAYTYDLRGRMTSITETPPSGPARVTTFIYDDAGQLESVEAPNGTILTYDYDAAHNLISVTDNDGNSIEYGYDLNGNLTDEDVRDPSSTLVKTVDYTYDARNRVETINSAGSVTDLVFDALGNLTDETDPNLNGTGHDYDVLNRVVETLDALSGVTEYGYDKNDYLTSVEAPNGATTSYVYDDFGNLLSMTSPDTGTTTYTYDSAGNRISETDANGVTVDYSYDALNRLTDIEYPNSALDVSLTYDGGTNQKSRLTTMMDGSGTTTFSYDTYGNLIEESKVIDANTHVTAYTYDGADLLETITYPSGRTVDYTRNVLGQVTEVETTYDTTTQTAADGVAYEPFGPLSGLTFGNTLAMSRDHDLQYRLTDQTTGSIQDLSFTLDAAGNIDGISDGVDVPLSQAFTQDPLHRVDYETGDYGTKDYTYDAVGNRLTRVHDTGSIATQTLTYLSNSNRLATHNGNTVTLDAAGNTSADPAKNIAFTYGDHNRMVQAYVGAVLQASYVYNGHGQRVKKVEAIGAKRTFIFHYGLSGELLAETIYDEFGGKIGERDYLWLDALPIAQSEREFSGSTITSSQFVYLHADQLNTPRLATNGSGTVVWRWDSDAFGVGDADLDPDSDTNDVNMRLRFPGQYFDAETGLHYNYFRDYDPVTGRYVQSDPIGLDGGLNTYLYANANPLMYSDPLGLDPTVGALPLPGSAAADAAAAAARAAAARAAAAAAAAGAGAGVAAGAAVAGTGLAAYGVGSLIYPHIEPGLSAAVDWMCMDSEEERCRKIKSECIAACSEFGLPSSDGTGTSFRRCIRNCMERRGCFNF